MARPKGSAIVKSAYKDKSSYNVAYQKEHRYVFSTNLDQEKDSDIIEALESRCGGNRQKALKELIRIAISKES